MLIGAVLGKRDFSTSDRLWVLKEERRDGKKDWYYANDLKLRGILNDQDSFNKCLFLLSNHTVSWLRVQITTVIGTVPVETEFRDFLCACYNVNPLNLKIKYEIFLKNVSVRHMLSCSNECIVITCLNEISDKIIHLARKDFSLHCISGRLEGG